MFTLLIGILTFFLKAQILFTIGTNG